MRAVVTGGAGFIGSHLTDLLVRNGAEVHVLDNLSTGSQAQVNRSAKLHVRDVRDESIGDLLLGIQPDYVFHLAAQIQVQKSISQPSQDCSVNIGGTVNLLEACRKAEVKKLIFSSTSAVYGDSQEDPVTERSTARPLSFYGLSKSSAEAYIRLYAALNGINYTILRYSNVYGPRQLSTGEGGVVAIFRDRIKRGEPLFIDGDGEQTRDFIYVKDVARANIASIRLGDKQTINISTGKKTSINELVRQMERITGVVLPIQYRSSRFGDIRNSCLDRSLAEKFLAWEPASSLSQGLEETVRL